MTYSRKIIGDHRGSTIQIAQRTWKKLQAGAARRRAGRELAGQAGAREQRRMTMQKLVRSGRDPRDFQRFFHRAAIQGGCEHLDELEGEPA